MYTTLTVVVVSPGGKNCRENLTQRDGLNKSYSLRINIDRNEFLVCNKNGPAFVFNLVHKSRVWNKLHQVRQKNQKIAIPNNFYLSYNVHNFNINTTIGCTTS
jgi:hypothetical protein